MTDIQVRVDIRRKDGLADPEGTTTLRALEDLGYAVREVRFGRTVRLTITGEDAEHALEATREMCARLLANPIIEDYDVSIEK